MGCATSQSVVAQTLNRLRLIDGVSAATLQSSTHRSLGRRRRMHIQRSRVFDRAHVRTAADRLLDGERDRHRIPRGCRMTGRDRMVIVAVATALILVMGWFLFVSPERQRAASLNTQVGAANAALATAKSQVQSARAAQAQYQAAYADVVRLGKAVPPSEEVSSLVYQIAQASHQKNVDFASVVSGAAGTGSAGAGGTAATALSGFTPMPFTFIFNGTLLRPVRPAPAARPLDRGHPLRAVSWSVDAC